MQVQCWDFFPCENICAVFVLTVDLCGNSRELSFTFVSVQWWSVDMRGQSEPVSSRGLVLSIEAS